MTEKTQNLAAVVTEARTDVDKQKKQIFSDLSAITSFNSVHSIPELAAEHAGACQWVVDQLEGLGLAVTEFPYDDGATTILGEKKPQGDAPTVMLYAHYDVVPAGDSAKWESDPFTLTERDGRWYARGAADCKGNLVMHLAALRTVAEMGGTDLGIKFLVEGSEEQGGEELSSLIHERPELFKADVILIVDSGNFTAGQPTLTTTLRGGARITVTMDTLASPVHSGSFGGAAPDAVAALMRTLDSLHDDAGRTVIDGVDTTKKWTGAQYSPEDFFKDAGILEGVSIMGTEEDNPADLVWARPAISVIGFSSTPVEQAVNAVPATAQARLNLRVPPEYDAETVAEAVKEHLIKHTPWGAHISVEIDDINQPFTASTSGHAIKLLEQCLSMAYGDKEVITIGSGGSIPLCAELLEADPSAELALYGVEDPQAGIHSPNESVDPQEILDIATAEASFLLKLGKQDNA